LPPLQSQPIFDPPPLLDFLAAHPGAFVAGMVAFLLAWLIGEDFLSPIGCGTLFVLILVGIAIWAVFPVTSGAPISAVISNLRAGALLIALGGTLGFLVGRFFY
jgi:hypothetical protein